MAPSAVPKMIEASENADAPTPLDDAGMTSSIAARRPGTAAAPAATPRNCRPSRMGIDGTAKEIMKRIAEVHADQTTIWILEAGPCDARNRSDSAPPPKVPMVPPTASTAAVNAVASVRVMSENRSWYTASQ